MERWRQNYRNFSPAPSMQRAGNAPITSEERTRHINRNDAADAVKACLMREENTRIKEAKQRREENEAEERKSVMLSYSSSRRTGVSGGGSSSVRGKTPIHGRLELTMLQGSTTQQKRFGEEPVVDMDSSSDDEFPDDPKGKRTAQRPSPFSFGPQRGNSATLTTVSSSKESHRRVRYASASPPPIPSAASQDKLNAYGHTMSLPNFKRKPKATPEIINCNDDKPTAASRPLRMSNMGVSGVSASLSASGSFSSSNPSVIELPNPPPPVGQLSKSKKTSKPTLHPVIRQPKKHAVELSPEPEDEYPSTNRRRPGVAPSTSNRQPAVASVDFLKEFTDTTPVARNVDRLQPRPRMNPGKKEKLLSTKVVAPAPVKALPALGFSRCRTGATSTIQVSSSQTSQGSPRVKASNRLPSSSPEPEPEDVGAIQTMGGLILKKVSYKPRGSSAASSDISGSDADVAWSRKNRFAGGQLSDRHSGARSMGSSASQEDVEIAELVRRKARDDKERFLMADASQITDRPHADPDSLCPYCSEPLPDVPSERLLTALKSLKSDSVPRPTVYNPRARFVSMVKSINACSLHRSESLHIPLARAAGWPLKIDWSDVKKRVLRRNMIEYLSGFVQDKMKSLFFAAAKQKVDQMGLQTSRSTRGQFEAYETIQPGYYGEIGSVLFHQLLSSIFTPRDGSTTSLLPSATRVTPSIAHPLTPSDFLHSVLVPELALRLIQQDLALPAPEDALDAMEKSRAYGNARFAVEEGEREGGVLMQAFEGSVKIASGGNDGIMVFQRAKVVTTTVKGRQEEEGPGSGFTEEENGESRFVNLLPKRKAKQRREGKKQRVRSLPLEEDTDDDDTKGSNSGSSRKRHKTSHPKSKLGSPPPSSNHLLDKSSSKISQPMLSRFRSSPAANDDDIDPIDAFSSTSSSLSPRSSSHPFSKHVGGGSNNPAKPLYIELLDDEDDGGGIDSDATIKELGWSRSQRIPPPPPSSSLERAKAGQPKRKPPSSSAYSGDSIFDEMDQPGFFD